MVARFVDGGRATASVEAAAREGATSFVFSSARASGISPSSTPRDRERDRVRRPAAARSSPPSRLGEREREREVDAGPREADARRSREVDRARRGERDDRGIGPDASSNVASLWGARDGVDDGGDDDHHGEGGGENDEDVAVDVVVSLEREEDDEAIDGGASIRRAPSPRPRRRAR